MTSSRATSAPSLRLVLSSLLRADFLVFLKHRRALIISLLLPVFVLASTSGNKATHNFGGAEFVIGLAIAYGLLSTSLIGYALTVPSRLGQPRHTFAAGMPRLHRRVRRDRHPLVSLGRPMRTDSQPWIPRSPIDGPDAW